jgi:hypothetical protein
VNYPANVEEFPFNFNAIAADQEAADPIIQDWLIHATI